MKDEHLLLDHWDKIPNDVDILMTHGPPRGIQDLTSGYQGDPPVKAGSGSLANKLEFGHYPNLKLHVFGHIHPAYGQIQLGDRIYANCSHVDNHYEPVNQPMEFDM
jgi:Icc-related predicted phosphoesterase